MDRIINIKVGGNYLTKDSKNAGVSGEGNVTKLRITFDEGWDGYAKTVTFWDAQGNNPVKRIEGIDLLEDITKDTRTYLTPIPPEPLAIAGELTFVIDGYAEGKRQRSISDKLVVKESPKTDNAEEPTDPTPTQAEQLQSQIDHFLEDVQSAVIASNDAMSYRDEAMLYRDEAISASDSAALYRDDAETSANNSHYYAERAEASIGKTSYIGWNGNWFAWDASINDFYDTGVKAQAGSTVYMGSNPPSEADVWVIPDGEVSSNEPVFVERIIYPDVLDYDNYTTSGVYFIVYEDGDYHSVINLYVWCDMDYTYQLEDGLYGKRMRQISNYGEASEWEIVDTRFTLEDAAKIKENTKRLDNMLNDVFGSQEFKEIESDVEGIKKQLNEEAHFRGYLSTNAKIQALAATPNDFAYSAESGTKWIYDATEGWQDSGTPVPDQLTPASNLTPLMNGEASVGTEEAYARGDHRHPTDTTRASVEELNRVERYAETLEEEIVNTGNDFNTRINAMESHIGEIGTALDIIIDIQMSLIGGDA